MSSNVIKRKYLQASISITSAVIPRRYDSNSGSAGNQHHDPGCGHPHLPGEEIEALRKKQPVQGQTPCLSNPTSTSGSSSQLRALSTCCILAPLLSCFSGSHLTSSDPFLVNLGVCLPSDLTLRYTAPIYLSILILGPLPQNKMTQCGSALFGGPSNYWWPEPQSWLQALALCSCWSEWPYYSYSINDSVAKPWISFPSGYLRSLPFALGTLWPTDR